MSEPQNQAVADEAGPATGSPPAPDARIEGLVDWNIIQEHAWTYTENLVFAIVILIVGLLVAKICSNSVRRWATKKPRIDKHIEVLMGKIVGGAVILFTVLAILNKFGIQTTAVIAVLGGLGLAIGLALQGSLSNIASGLLILVLRPFKIGSVIRASGEVYIIDDIGMFATRAHLPDGPRVTIPNNKLWGDQIVNLSECHDNMRRIDEVVGISYDDDLDLAFSVLQDILAGDERYLKEPAPLIAVDGFGDSSVNILVRVWALPPDWWKAKLDLRKAIKQRLDAADITIPFPQRDVHLIQSSSSTATGSAASPS